MMMMIFFGCDNCVELWLRDDPSLRSKYGLDKNNEKMIIPEEHEKIVKEKEEVIQENKLLRHEDEKLKNEREKIMKENTLLVEKNQKLEEEKEKITEENKVIKQEYQKLQNENETVIQKNNSLKHENLILKNENEVKSKENELLKQENQRQQTENEKTAKENFQLIQENQKLKSDLSSQKTSIKNFVSTIESDYHQHLLHELSQLNNIIEQSRNINLNEIRNLKLSEDSCIYDKDMYSDFICSICLDMVENPVSCSICDKLNCSECINFNNACPNCREGNAYVEAQLNRIVKNNLGNLKFLCPLGCSTQFKYEFKQRHFSECPNKDRIASKCSLCRITLNEDLKTHSRKCEVLKTSCLYCNNEISKLDLEDHLKECKSYILPCEACKVGFPAIFQKAHSDYYCNRIVTIKNKIHDFIQSI